MPASANPDTTDVIASATTVLRRSPSSRFTCDHLDDFTSPVDAWTVLMQQPRGSPPPMLGLLPKPIVRRRQPVRRHARREPQVCPGP